MTKLIYFSIPLFCFVGSLSFAQEEKKAQATSKEKISHHVQSFTGRILGNNVRLRAKPDLESDIVQELQKDDLIVVLGEKGDFYEVEPLPETKAYIFRSFIIDNIVEGERVNVRLAPDRDATVIGHLSTGTHIEGKICESNKKWLEIQPPETTRFFIAKEFLEYAGNRELKAITDKRQATVNSLLDSANLFAQAEMRKPFNEIDFERIKHNYNQIIQEYSDFSKHVESAKKSLTALQESFLTKKIAYLESKASHLTKKGSSKGLIPSPSEMSKESLSPSDRMKLWEPLEESLYLTWSSMHHAKNMEDFYEDQRLKSSVISGILEAYTDPVKNKPGDYIIKENDVPVGYVYSTHIDLQNLVGKQVNLVVTNRPNNNFAFPAFYVLDVE